MTFQKYYLLQEKTLYHGTVNDHKADIEKYGLIPTVGNWVKNAYGTDYDFESQEDVYGSGFDDPEEYWAVVFAGDKAGIESALGGIRFHVGKKLNKHLTEVTWNDIKNHGMLAVIDGDDTDMVQHLSQNDKGFRKYNDEHNPPPSVEPDDYWTRNSVKPKYVLTGEALIRFLNKFGLLSLKSHGPQEKDDKRIQAKITNLFRLVKMKHPEKTVDDIKQKIDRIKDNEKDLDKWIDVYKEYAGELPKTW